MTKEKEENQSLDEVRKKRDELISKRNDLLVSQNYKDADKLLGELQVLNEIFNDLLKVEMQKRLKRKMNIKFEMEKMLKLKMRKGK